MIRSLKNLYHKLQAFGANVFYGFPSNGLTIIGVTGTDGKTTTVSMIHHVLNSASINTGMISTVEVKINKKSYDAGLHVTTPEPWQLPKYLRLMQKENVKYSVIEATSNGLDQNRLQGISFDSVVITNIRNDHLDYHGTWEKYAKAKYRLVEKVRLGGLVVLNKDDENSYVWLKSHVDTLDKEIKLESVSKKDLIGKEMTTQGLSFKYKNVDFHVPMIGEHNFENAMQVIKICEKYTSLENIRNGLSTFIPPKGRMEVLQTEPYSVIVDFAHTPQALHRALTSLNQLKTEKGARIISVFGCAGQRDKGRRKMGTVSAQLSDITILTAEDPRDEKLFDINNEILDYAKKQNGKLVCRFENNKQYTGSDLKGLVKKVNEVLRAGMKPIIAFDEDTSNSRKDAIDLAIKLAQPSDMVFVTGKGHEKSLAFGSPVTETPWSDQEYIAERLSKLVK